MTPETFVARSTERPASLPSSDRLQASISPEKVAAAQDGCRDAQSELAEAIRPLIERQLLRYPLTDEDRLDVLQTTQIQIIRRLSSFRGNSSFTTWLFRVTANEALMLMRSQRRLRARITAGVDFDDVALPVEAVTAGGDLTSSMLENERDSRVRSAVAQLPEHYQAVVSAHYVDELGLQEIALRLSLTESAVRSRLHRARACLRDLLLDVADVGSTAQTDRLEVKSAA